MSLPELYTEALLSREPFVVRRRVLWGECDPAGVVYTPRFADYVAAARDWFIREGLGFADRPHPARVQLTYPARALSFDFLGFLAADDYFDMAVGVADISRRTFTLEVVATYADRPALTSFTARLTSVCVDQAIGKSVSLPDPVRAALGTYRWSRSSPS